MSKYYEIVIYTASLSVYAEPLLKVLDPHNHASHRLFREHCVFLNNIFVKDLRRLGREMKDVIIVDNSPACYSLQPENAVPIATWTEDQNDGKLMELLPLLKLLAHVGDVRPHITRLVGEDDVDYLAAARELEAELNGKLKSNGNCLTKSSKSGKNPFRNLSINHSKTAESIAKKALNTETPDSKGGSSDVEGKKPLHIAAGKNLVVGVKGFIPRMPALKADPFGKDMKFFRQQQGQIKNNISDGLMPKTITKPLQPPTQKEVGRPSTVGHKDTPLCVSSAQTKEEAKSARLHNGKPVLMASLTNPGGKRHRHTNSAHSPAQMANKLRLKSVAEGKAETGELSSRDVRIMALKCEVKQERCLAAKGNKRVARLKINIAANVPSGSKAVNIYGNMKPTIKAKGGNTLIVNAMQAADNNSKKSIIFAHNIS
eukprot:TRINITY_DN7883_c0_g1_i15.p1 TRINITY_DN7883_c0_g1~~TRINITY_DN7883_c0_g1_i15.p1  ORF type:complete len:429 (-),score=89.29 TRINITY_DN7883_c0_g1_i15:161-1447(-)